MKRLIPFGICMSLLGCLGGPDDGSDPATSSPSGTDTEVTGEVTVDSRGAFGAFAQTPTGLGAVAPEARPLDRQGLETAAVVENIRPVFDAESYKRNEIFRMRMGVQR